MVEGNLLVSIIVPVYRTEAYLPACIESLRAQSYPNIQIILVDDQSPDKSPEICDAYAKKDDRITVIHQDNKGVSGARNTGLRHATGDYIMFVDSDDELYPDAVKILLEDVCRYGADVVSATSETVDEKGRIVDIRNDGSCAFFRGDEPLLLLLDEDPSTYVVWAKIYRADFIRDVCFEEGKDLGEDSFFLFQCYIRKPLLVQHDVVIYRQNIRPGSSSRVVFSDKFLSLLYFFDKKKESVTTYYPQYIEKIYQMECCLNLRLLAVLCSTTDKKYKALQKRCIETVRRLHSYYTPINKHHELLSWIVVHGLYPLYKMLVRVKYHR